MWRAEAQVKKEWPLPVFLDERGCAFIEALLQPRIIHILLRQLHSGTGGGIKRERFHVVAVRQAEKQVKPVIGGRPIWRHMAKVPLANNRAGIFRLQRLGNRDLRERQPVHVLWYEDLASKAGTNCVTPGQEASARRRTQIGSGIEVSQPHTFACHLIYGWGFDRGAAERSHIAKTQIIAEHNDEVGFAGARLGLHDPRRERSQYTSSADLTKEATAINSHFCEDEF